MDAPLFPGQENIAFFSFQKDEATQINQKNENGRANFFMDDLLK